MTLFAPDLDVRMRLEKLLTKHVAERAELLAAGVSAHRVESLYPLDFELLFHQSSSYLLEQELPARVREAQWRANISVAYALRECIEGAERKQYESQWAEHYGRELQTYIRIQRHLHEQGYSQSDSDYFAGWYGRMLFVSYWLVLNPELPQASSLASEDLMNWIDSNVLPKTIAKA